MSPQRSMRIPAVSAPVLSDGVVVLRAPATEDVELITQACQDRLIARWTTVPAPYRRSDAQAWVDERTTDWWSEPTWAVTLPGGGWAGSVSLRPDGQGAASVGYLVAPWLRGRQLATRALRLTCAWGFSTLGLQVITWTAQVGNDASRTVAERVGFKVHRDVARRALLHRGQRVDAWVGDVLPDDLIEVGAARPRPNEPVLTRREREVLAQLALGRANRQIATALGISENTVKNHVRSILDKLHAASRVDAVVRGLQLGLTQLP